MKIIKTLYTVVIVLFIAALPITAYYLDAFWHNRLHDAQVELITAYYLDASWHKQQHDAEVRLNSQSKVHYPYYPFIHSQCIKTNSTYHYSSIIEYENGQSVSIDDTFSEGECLMQIMLKHDSLLPRIINKEIDDLKVPLSKFEPL